jgi:hypothetical protein
LYTLLLTVVTAILCFVAWIQLKGIKKTSKADFINKFNKDFFTDETRKLILLLSYNALEFKIDEIEYGENVSSISYPYFDVNQEIIKQFPKNGTDKDMFPKRYSSFEIDDLLLGYFEEIGNFEKDSLIGISKVYTNFDWYIQMVWANQAIQEYINHTHESDGDDIYEDFEYIYNKSKSFGDAKSKNSWMWFWQVRWFISNLILKRQIPPRSRKHPRVWPVFR